MLVLLLCCLGIVSSSPVVMVGGGSTDPNLSALVAQLRKRGNSKVVTVMMGPNSVYPDITWDMDSDKLTLDGMPIKPDAAFLRYDGVFAGSPPLPLLSPACRCSALRYAN